MARRALQLVTVAAAVVLAGCWPQPGFGPHRSGHNPFEDELTVANVSTLARAWAVDLGAGAVQDPAVSSDGVHAVIGRRLETRRLGDGIRRWSRQVLPQDLGGLPASVGAASVHGDDVLVPAAVYRHFAEGSGTHAYDTGSGAGGEIVAPAESSSVTVAGDTVAGLRVDAAPGIFLVTLLVTDLADPEEGWSTAVSLSSTGVPATTPAIAGGRVLLGSGTSVLAFTVAPPECDPGPPRRCQPEWTRSLGAETTVPVVSADGEVVFVGDSAGGVWALDAADGAVLWRADVGGGGARAVRAAPTLGDGSLFVATSDGRLYAFDADGCGAATCTPVWDGATGSPIGEQAALAGGVLYVGSDDGSIDAFVAGGCGAAHCSPVWQRSTGSRITGAPAVASGHLVVGTEDGRLIAYEPS